MIELLKWSFSCISNFKKYLILKQKNIKPNILLSGQIDKDQNVGDKKINPHNNKAWFLSTPPNILEKSRIALSMPKRLPSRFGLKVKLHFKLIR